MIRLQCSMQNQRIQSNQRKTLARLHARGGKIIITIIDRVAEVRHLPDHRSLAKRDNLKRFDER